jgi:phosphohistidine phosphatase
MRRLILLRHAKAESVSAGGGDIDRALAPRGWRDAELIGRVLAEAGFSPDLVVMSPARRTLETWRAMAESFPAATVQEASSLYLASVEQIAAQADRGAAGGGSVMIIGHNPGMHEFAGALAVADPHPSVDRAALMRSFPTAAAAVFEADSQGRLRLSRFLAPKDHGGGAA